MGGVYALSVREIAHSTGQMRQRQFTVQAAEVFGAGLATVAAGENLDLTVRLESVHEGILASVFVQTRLSAQCGRCLQDFSKPCEVEFQELFAYNPTEADEYGVHGDHVDLEPPLRDAVVLALPFQPVCRADCPGLDPVTGQLRDAAVGVATDEIVDPRWAALADFKAVNNADSL